MSKNNGTFKTICFVCTANICRSPFAEYFLRKRLHEEGIVNFEVTSCGVQASDGRATTPAIIAIGNEFDVDLTDHRSKRASSELFTPAKFIIGMEKFHCDEIKLNFAETDDRIFLMRNFAEAGSRTRGGGDPFGLSADFIRNCFDDIAEAIEGVLVKLKAS